MPFSANMKVPWGSLMCFVYLCICNVFLIKIYKIAFTCEIWIGTVLQMSSWRTFLLFSHHNRWMDCELNIVVVTKEICLIVLWKEQIHRKGDRETFFSAICARSNYLKPTKNFVLMPPEYKKHNGNIGWHLKTYRLTSQNFRKRNS